MYLTTSVLRTLYPLRCHYTYVSLYNTVPQNYHPNSREPISCTLSCRVSTESEQTFDGAVGVALVYDDEVYVVELEVPQRLPHRLDDFLPGQRSVLCPAEHTHLRVAQLPAQLEGSSSLCAIEACINC
jgi:hypothetical protein